MNDRYPYLKARSQRIARELAQIIEGCENILVRTHSTLNDTARGKLNPDVKEEANVAKLRKRAKDALLLLKDATE